MKYTFGVMSREWTLESDNEKDAYVAMALFIAKNIPIAIFEPNPKAIIPLEILQADHKRNAEEVRKLQSIIETIKVSK